MLTSSYPRYKGDACGVFVYTHFKVLSQKYPMKILVPDHHRGVQPDKEKVVFRYFIPSLQKLNYGSGILPNIKRAPWLILELPFFFPCSNSCHSPAPQKRSRNQDSSCSLVDPPRIICGSLSSPFLSSPKSRLYHSRSGPLWIDRILLGFTKKLYLTSQRYHHRDLRKRSSITSKNGK